jgi:hypothetical protein
MKTAERLMLAFLFLVPLSALADDDGFTRKFPLASCFFVGVGGSPYFPLIPGRQTYFSNSACVAAGTCDSLTESWITMERETRRISIPVGKGNRTLFARVMEERETEDGEVVSHDGAWLAGRRGALPGILMPEDGFMLGSRYYQEVAPDVALDRAEHKRAGFPVRVPAGAFDHCVDVEETTPLEPGAISKKTYCRGVGLVRDGELELTAIYTSRH